MRRLSQFFTFVPTGLQRSEVFVSGDRTRDLSHVVSLVGNCHGSVRRTEWTKEHLTFPLYDPSRAVSLVVVI